jgi:hypothetical protein
MTIAGAVSKLNLFVPSKQLIYFILALYLLGLIFKRI